MKDTTLPLVCGPKAALHTSLRAAICLASLLTTATHPARAAVIEAWVQHYSNVVSNSTDQAVKVVRDAAGDIIVTGSSDDGISRPDQRPHQIRGYYAPVSSAFYRTSAP